MKARTFELRGLPAFLMLAVLTVMVVGLVALFLMVGVAVVVVGLVLSVGAALYYAVRRKLSPATPTRAWEVEDSTHTQTSNEVREIEVEVLSHKEC